MRDFAETAGSAAEPNDRRLADLAAGFGSEVVVDRDGLLTPTRFSKQNGNSGKNMLLDVSKLMSSVSRSQLAHALFEPWSYSDEGRSLGWDPRDVRPYALQATDPAAGSRTVHGANVLAYEALGLFPAVPRGRGLVTTGTETVAGAECFSWPVWDHPLVSSVVRSALALSELHEPRPDRTYLRARGIAAVYRCVHYTDGKSQRFRPAEEV
jgi:hypothetical protein